MFKIMDVSVHVCLWGIPTLRIFSYGGGLETTRSERDYCTMIFKVKTQILNDKKAKLTHIVSDNYNLSYVVAL